LGVGLSLCVGGVVVLASLVYGGFQLYRYINWEFGYESKVEEKICASVKHEHLQDGVTCPNLKQD
jgi:hypothetical protein